MRWRDVLHPLPAHGTVAMAALLEFWPAGPQAEDRFSDDCLVCSIVLAAGEVGEPVARPPMKRQADRMRDRAQPPRPQNRLLAGQVLRPAPEAEGRQDVLEAQGEVVGAQAKHAHELGDEQQQHAQADLA